MTLKWLYGKITCQIADEFSARQRELRAGRDRETAILELYEDIAYAWRLLQVGACVGNECQLALNIFSCVGMAFRVIQTDALFQTRAFFHRQQPTNATAWRSSAEMHAPSSPSPSSLRKSATSAPCSRCGDGVKGLSTEDNVDVAQECGTSWLSYMLVSM